MSKNVFRVVSASRPPNPPLIYAYFSRSPSINIVLLGCQVASDAMIKIGLNNDSLCFVVGFCVGLRLLRFLVSEFIAIASSKLEPLCNHELERRQLSLSWCGACARAIALRFNTLSTASI